MKRPLSFIKPQPRPIPLPGNIRNLYRLDKHNNKIKDRILEVLQFLFTNDDNCYEIIGTKGSFTDNYIELNSNGDRYKKLAQYRD